MQHIAPSQRPADPSTLAEVAHLRRALRDAGLLGPSSSSSAGPRSFADLTPAQRAALNGASPAILVAAAAAMAGPAPAPGGADVAGDETSEEHRARRRAERRQRRRREREAQRERDEGLGLPTYSRKVADGEETLQRAEGWKTDASGDEDGEAEDDSGESGDERERERGLEGARVGPEAGAVVPTLDGAHPRAGTSSRSEPLASVVPPANVRSTSPPSSTPPPARSEP